MSIESAISNAQTKVANAYTAIENKGGTLPETQNLSNLPTAINSIQGGGILENSLEEIIAGSNPVDTTELQSVETQIHSFLGVGPALASLTVTPSTTAQTLTPPSGTDGYNTVIASAVTASIDSDIQAGNIKSGINILGVSGTVTELAGETRTVSITSTSGNTFTPSSGKNGITSIKCNPTNKALTITPSATSQTFTVPSGYSGYGTVTCNAASGGGGSTTIRFTSSQISSVEAYSGYNNIGGTSETGVVDEFLGALSFIDVVITDEPNDYSVLDYYAVGGKVVLACPYLGEGQPFGLYPSGVGTYYNMEQSIYLPTDEVLKLVFLSVSIEDGFYYPYTVIVTIPNSS